jgi:hypothetical protein
LKKKKTLTTASNNNEFRFYSEQQNISFLVFIKTVSAKNKLLKTTQKYTVCYSEAVQKSHGERQTGNSN